MTWRVQILLHCDGKVQIYFQEVSLGSGQLISGLSDGGSPSGETDLSGCEAGPSEPSKPSAPPPPSSTSEPSEPSKPATPSPAPSTPLPTTTQPDLGILSVCSQAPNRRECKKLDGCDWQKNPEGKGKKCMEESTPVPTPAAPTPVPTPLPTDPPPTTPAPTTPSPSPLPTPSPTTPAPKTPSPSPAAPTTSTNSGNFYCGASNCNNRIEAAWCNVNEGQCSQCKGQWCPEIPPTFFCGYQSCGKSAGKWCQFTQNVCEFVCFGTWCPDTPS